jgi:MFS transporter, DHA1 family, tetracycline resistance protein
MQKHQAALGFIFVTVLIDVIGLGIIAPVIPTLIEELVHGGLSQAATYGGWLTFAYAVMSFVFAPVMGGLSDQYGRRAVLLLSLSGFSLDYLFLAFAPTIGWLFVGRIIAGIMGASFTTATAYIADISTPDKRAQNFGLLGAAFGLGFIIGPALGGILGQFGARIPFLAAAGLAFLNALYGYFILPESLAPENRRKFDIRRANPLGSLMQLFKYPVVTGLVASLVLIYIAGQSVQSVWGYFTMESFGWGPKEVGYSLGFVGLAVAIVQGGLIRVIIPKIGQKRSVYIGLAMMSLGLGLISLAKEGWQMYVFFLPYALSGLAGPSLQGIISAQVPPNEQGELQGGLTSLVSLTGTVGPPLMTGLFSYFTQPGAPIYFPGAPYLTGSVLALISVLLAARSLRRTGTGAVAADIQTPG